MICNDIEGADPTVAKKKVDVSIPRYWQSEQIFVFFTCVQSAQGALL
jgi:hypothetical protein